MSTQTDLAGLAGLHILITRPEQQAAAICRQLTEGGVTVSCLPVIEISPPLSKDKACHVLQQIDKYDNVIFVSRNAVVWAFRLCEIPAANGTEKISRCPVCPRPDDFCI